MIIERAGRTTSKLLEGLHAAAFYRPGDETWSERAFSDVLNSPGSFCLLAISKEADGNEPCGFAACRVRSKEAELLSIGVSPDFRRSGVARALIKRVVDMCQEAGALDLFLEVAEDNPTAHQLYCDVGFEQVGTRKNYYQRLNGVQVHARTMRLLLD